MEEAQAYADEMHDMEAMCRRAYDNQYHKIKADMSYDQWRMVWIKAIATHESG